MQRTFLIVTALITAGLGSPALAQGQPSQQQAPAFTKVGVVNMGVVFSQYNRVKTFKSEMERDAEPFKQKKAELDKLIGQWQQAMQNINNPDPKQRIPKETYEQGQRVLIECKRRLEDLEVEFKKVVGKKLEDQMVTLNNEIREKIKAYAGANGYHLVLAFGEPEQPLPHLVDFQRRMKVIDQGGLTVAYYAPNIDISSEIVRVLNSSYQPEPVNQRVPPKN